MGRSLRVVDRMRLIVDTGAVIVGEAGEWLRSPDG
jgi:hypothetical protein